MGSIGRDEVAHSYVRSHCGRCGGIVRGCVRCDEVAPAFWCVLITHSAGWEGGVGDRALGCPPHKQWCVCDCDRRDGCMLCGTCEWHRWGVGENKHISRCV